MRPAHPTPPSFSIVDQRILLRAAGGSAWLVSERILKLLLGVLSSVFVARSVGASGYGTLSYVVSFAALFSGMATLNLHGVVVRELVTNPRSEGAILGTAWSLMMAGSLVALGGAWGTLRLLPPQDPLVVTLILLTVIAGTYQAFDVVDMRFQAMVDVGPVTRARLLVTALMTVVRVGFAALHAPVPVFALTFCIEPVFTGLLGWTVYWHHGGRVRSWHMRISRLRPLLQDSWPFALAGIVSIVYLRIDMVLLRWLLSERDVGIYAVAIRIVETWHIVPVSVMGVALPILIAQRQHDMSTYLSQLQRLFSLLCGATYAAVGFLVLAGGFLVQVLFGREYLEAVPLVRVAAFSLPFVTLGVVRSAWYIAENAAVCSLVAHGVAALVGIVCNLMLIPVLGTLGAAVTTVATQCVAGYLSTALPARSRGVFVQQSQGLLLVGFLRAIRELVGPGDVRHH